VICGCTISGTGSSLLRYERPWFAGVEAKTSDVDFAMAPDKESAKDGPSEEIENSIENSLRIRRDDVATL